MIERGRHHDHCTTSLEGVLLADAFKGG